MLPQMIAAHLFHEGHVHLSRQQGMGASCGALISTLLTRDYQIHVPCTSEKLWTEFEHIGGSEGQFMQNFYA